MNTIENQTFDEERALYNLKVTNVIGCRFEGAADGESVLKEASSIVVDKCSFSLRYPMWHNRALVLRDSHLCEPSPRAALVLRGRYHRAHPHRVGQGAARMQRLYPHRLHDKQPRIRLEVQRDMPLGRLARLRIRIFRLEGGQHFGTRFQR